MPLDPRRDIEAWKPGTSYLVVRDPNNSKSAPACWDGSDDPLTPNEERFLGLMHLPNGCYITSLATDIRPWMNSHTHVGVNCLWEGKIVWFIVDTDMSRDPNKRPYGYELVEVRQA